MAGTDSYRCDQSEPGGETKVEVPVLRLQVGEPVQLEVLSDGRQQRRHVKVIGYLPGKSLLVTAPTTGGKVMLMREGQVVNVRLMTGGKVYAFTSPVLRAPVQPYPYLHIGYPNALSSVQVRRAQRVPVHLVAAVQNETAAKQNNGDSPLVAAQIADISVGGALLECQHLLGEIGDVVNISARLKVGALERYLSIPGVIRSSHPPREGEEPAHACGVEFLVERSDDALVLHGFVYEQIVSSVWAR
jgi:c-di-GMP-binding flagellar brake protein YcgR